METLIKRGCDFGLVIAVGLMTGCGPKGEPAALPTTPPAAAENRPPAHAASSRSLAALPPGSVFSDLVRAAAEPRTVKDMPQCMLQQTRDGWRFDGEREVLIRPTPQPTDDVFDQVLASGGRIGALTKRGLIGDASPLVATLGPLALEADEPVRVIIVSHAGTFVRRTDLPRDEGPLELDGLRTAAAALRGDAPTVVTASASVPVDAIANVLVLLQKHTRNIALGVVLPKGTRAPQRTPPNDGAHRCAVPKPTTGSLTVAQLAPALQSLREEATRCYESLPAHAQLTWRVPLRLTIAPNGAVSEACFEEPSLPQVFESCLVSRSKEIAFPKPRPRGTVTLRIPLRFVPKDKSAKLARPVCLGGATDSAATAP